MRKRSVKLAAADIAETAIFVALMIATGMAIHIPTPLMDITFQTLVAVLAGLMLGSVKGAAAMLVYAFMGLVGLPVFTQGGGIFYVFQGTFGYIIGFVVSAFVGGAIRGGDVNASLRRYIMAAVTACLIDYAVGIGYYIVLHFAYFHRTAESLGAIVSAHIGWFLPKDAVLCVVAAFVAFKVTPVVAVRRRRLENGGIKIKSSRKLGKTRSE